MKYFKEIEIVLKLEKQDQTRLMNHNYAQARDQNGELFVHWFLFENL